MYSDEEKEREGERSWESKEKYIPKQLVEMVNKNWQNVIDDCTCRTN